MNQKNVVVLFGGCSAEHEVSVTSAASIINALDHHHIIPVYISKSGKWLLYDGKLDPIKNIDWEKFGTPAVLSPDRVNRGLLRIVGGKVKTIPVDVVFPVLHGTNGEDGTIQGLCELAGIPYVGSGVLSSALCMDKSFANIIARSLNIPQPDYFVFKDYELEQDLDGILRKIRYKLGYPCFVKPAAGGSSVGISKVNNKKELKTAIETAGKLGNKIIAEKAVRGNRDVECAVIGSRGRGLASLPGEIIPDGEFYDYEAKYIKTGSKTIVPAGLPEETVQLIQRYSLDMFDAMDCKGLARVDFFIDANGRVLFNEINTIPGFTPISLYPLLLESNGMTRIEWIEKLIETALN